MHTRYSNCLMGLSIRQSMIMMYRTAVSASSHRSNPSSARISTMPLTVTFIRHGESEDNKHSIWAGWKDAPLSDLGHKQAYAVGQYFSTTKLDYIYSSPLLRAHTTGKAVLDAQPEPRPPFSTNPKLREQYFGIAEGHPWVLDTPPHNSLQELFDKGIFPVLSGRDAKFPDAESLNDLAHRADEAIAECVLPHLLQDPGHPEKNIHVAIASHGLCISELVAALIRLDPTPREYKSYAGLLNTAWTRATVSVKNAGRGESSVNSSNLPPLTVNITDVNRAEHLETIPSVDDGTVDENQNSEARAFFGGGKATSVSNADVIVDKDV